MATRGYENFTATDAARHALKHAPKQKRGKYGSVKTTTDGIQFDSAKEARRYQELLNLVRVGVVRNLRVQPRYTLFALVLAGADLHDANRGTIDNQRHPVCEYVADFEYEELMMKPAYFLPVVEDVKSIATRRKEVYRLKRKLFEAQYGIQIREV